MLFGFSEQLRNAISTPLSAAERPDYEACLASLRSNLDEAEFADSWAVGRAMEIDQAVEFVLEIV
jgi:hypothetical protein